MVGGVARMAGGRTKPNCVARQCANEAKTKPIKANGFAPRTAILGGKWGWWRYEAKWRVSERSQWGAVGSGRWAIALGNSWWDRRLACHFAAEESAFQTWPCGPTTAE